MAERSAPGEPDNVVELRPGQLPPADLNAVEALVHIRTLIDGLSNASDETLIDVTLDMIRVLIAKSLK